MRFARSAATSSWRPRGGVARVGVEEGDGVLAAVAGEMPVVWRSIIARLAPMKRERSKIEIPARSAKVA
jgi:hypothetical protein